MSAITIPRQSTPPENPGLYLVLQRGASTPCVAWYSERDRGWRDRGRRIEVTHWTGPVHSPRELHG